MLMHKGDINPNNHMWYSISSLAVSVIRSLMYGLGHMGMDMLPKY